MNENISNRVLFKYTHKVSIDTKSALAQAMASVEYTVKQCFPIHYKTQWAELIVRYHFIIIMFSSRAMNAIDCIASNMEQRFASNVEWKKGDVLV